MAVLTDGPQISPINVKPSIYPLKDEFKVRVPQEKDSSKLKQETAERQKKIEKHVAKLQKRLIQIHREIKKLEEAEVSWDDEEDSAYLKEDKYKKKAVQINKAIRKLQNESESNARILEEKLKVKDESIKKEWIRNKNFRQYQRLPMALSLGAIAHCQ